MFKHWVATGLLIGSLLAGTMVSTLAFSDADPSARDIYAAAEAGHLAQARSMIDRVLKDHPNNAKARYISAELYARQNDFADARAELNQAERLQPGLPFAKPLSVTALKRELSAASRPTYAAAAYARPASSIPWGLVFLIVVGVLAVVWMLSRRNRATSYPPGNAMAMPVGGTPPYGPSMPGATPGIGSTLMGGLAGGLAMGAGVVAGEELAHHFLDGNSTPTVAPLDSSMRVDPTAADFNTDMGGTDFGITDNSDWSGGDSFGIDSGGDDWN